MQQAAAGFPWTFVVIFLFLFCVLVAIRYFTSPDSKMPARKVVKPSKEVDRLLEVDWDDNLGV